MATALLLASGVALLAACAPSPGGINVVREADLDTAAAIEVSERSDTPGTDYSRQGTITDPATLQPLLKALDRLLPLGPLVDCVPQYRLRFVLADGRAQEFDYFCEGGASFLQGGQSFWKQQKIQPPAEFDELVRKAMARLQ